MILAAVRSDLYDIENISPEQITHIDTDHVLFFTHQGRETIIIHTLSDEYALVFPTQLNSVEKAFQWFGFRKLDSVNVVNMMKVLEIEVDFHGRTAKFDGGKYTSVSGSGLKMVKKKYPEIPIVQ